jgi:hypothetical protein
MSSATSTDHNASDGLDRTGSVRPQADHGLQPWQFFTLAALGCATAVSFIARGQGATVIILLTILIAAAGLVGYAALRAVRPLVSPEEDRTAMVGQRTRAALEREKLLTLRSIKELEFDRAMGRLSEEDFKEMSGRLRVRAAGLIRQLDAGTGYREQIEKDLAKRMGQADARLKGSRPSDGVRSTDAGPTDASALAAESTDGDERSASLSGERVCASCQTRNDPDARFCKSCGQAIPSH